MALDPTTRDEQAPAANLDRQLLLYKLQKFGLIEARAEGGWRLTQHAATGLAMLEGGHARALEEPQPSKIRPWIPRRLSD